MGICSSKSEKKKRKKKVKVKNGEVVKNGGTVRSSILRRSTQPQYPSTVTELPYDFDPSEYVRIVERNDNDFNPSFNFSYTVETLPPPRDFHVQELFIYEYHCRCLQWAFDRIINLKRRLHTRLNLGYLSIGTQMFHTPEVNVYIELKKVHLFDLRPHMSCRMNRMAAFTRAMVTVNQSLDDAEQLKGVRKWTLSMTISGNPNPGLTTAELNVVRLAQNCHSLELINGELFDPTKIEVDALRDFRDQISANLLNRTIEQPNRKKVAIDVSNNKDKTNLPVVDSLSIGLSRRSSMADVINMTLESQTDGYMLELRPFIVVDPDEVYKVNCRLLQEAVDNIIINDFRQLRAPLVIIQIKVNFAPHVVEKSAHNHIKWLAEVVFNLEKDEDDHFDIRPHLDIRVDCMPAVADVLYEHKSLRFVKLHIKPVPLSSTLRHGAESTYKVNLPGLATNLYVASLKRISDYDSVVHSQILKNPELYVEKYKSQFK